MFENPILRTYDSIDADGGDLVFGCPASEDIRDLHPSTVHIFRLWQRFLDSVDPLIKIFHTPTVQQQVLDATAALDEVPKGVEALMFGIYSMAIASFAERDCLSIFGETKATLLKRYQSGARLALQRAGLLRSSDLTILQAFVLYLVTSNPSFLGDSVAYSLRCHVSILQWTLAHSSASQASLSEFPRGWGYPSTARVTVFRRLKWRCGAACGGRFSFSMFVWRNYQVLDRPC